MFSELRALRTDIGMRFLVDSWARLLSFVVDCRSPLQLSSSTTRFPMPRISKIKILPSTSARCVGAFWNCRLHVYASVTDIYVAGR